MKIFLDTRYIKKSEYTYLIQSYPKYTYTFDEEEDCDILVGFFGEKKQSFFDQFKQLKWIILISSGYNHLDLDYLKRRSITVTNAKGIYGISISEDVVSKMLYFDKNIYKYRANQKLHLWKEEKPHYELYQQQALILGTGSIGIEVAKRLKGFDMEVVGYKRTYEKIKYFDKIISDKKTLNAYYQTCDYLIITLPSNKHTRHMIDQSVFNQLKPSVLLINIGRGDIIAQDDLVIALHEGKLRGAALDVVTPEPLPTNHPLWDMEQVLITPHSSSLSPKIQRRRLEMVIDLFNLHEQKKKLFNIVLEGDLDA